MVQPTPYIAIQLGDTDPKTGEPRTRHLRITFATLMTLEANGTRSILNGTTWTRLDITELCEFLALALKHEDPRITGKYVLEYVGPHNMAYLFEALASAWNTSHYGKPEYVPLEVALAA